MKIKLKRIKVAVLVFSVNEELNKNSQLEFKSVHSN
jgi:hypothetical protein